MYDKDKECQNRFYVHFTQPFPPGTVSETQAHRMGIQLIESNPEIFSGYQVVMATHTDQAHLHNHFVLNTVNQETGKMWHQTKKDLQNLKEKDIELCKACGLQITWRGNGDKQPTQNRGEYEALKRGVSWKQEMSATVEYCLTKSVDQWNFMLAMKAFGYRINWWTNREDITIISPEGWRCGSQKLNREWTQERLSTIFGVNRDNVPVQSDYAIKRALSGKTEMMIRTVNYAIYEAEDRQAFLEMLDTFGYEVNWQDNIKNITIKVSDEPNKRGMRLTTLIKEQNWDKETLLTQFEKNKVFHEQLPKTSARALDDETKGLLDLSDSENRINYTVNACARRALSYDDFKSKVEIFGYEVEAINGEIKVFDQDFEVPLQRLDCLKGPEKWNRATLNQFFERNTLFKLNHTEQSNVEQEVFHRRASGIAGILKSLLADPDDGPKKNSRNCAKLSGQALKEKAIELASASMIDWENEY